MLDYVLNLLNYHVTVPLWFYLAGLFLYLLAWEIMLVGGLRRKR